MQVKNTATLNKFIIKRMKDIANVKTNLDLAGILSVSNSAISNWKNYIEIPPKIILTFCELYDIKSKQLSIPDDNNSNRTETLIKDSYSFTSRGAMEKIPIVPLVSAGEGIFPTDDIFDEWVSCPPGLQSQKHFAMRIDKWANSMMPFLKPGMLIIASKETKAVDGDIVVVHYKDCNEVYCKQIYYEKNKIRLHSFNFKYEDKFIDKDKLIYAYPVIWMRRAK